jgi:hypothetical protein
MPLQSDGLRADDMALTVVLLAPRAADREPVGPTRGMCRDRNPQRDAR